MNKNSEDAGTDAPRWNIKEVYAGLSAPELLSDRELLEELALDFQAAYEGHVARLSGEELGEALAEYEEIYALHDKIRNYTTLLEGENRKNVSATEEISAWSSTIGMILAFFPEEIADMKEKDLITKLVAPGLAQYAPWIARQRHRYLTSAEEDPSGQDAEYWQRLYTKTISDLEADTPPGTSVERQDMAGAIKRSGDQFALIYNALAQDKLDAEDARDKVSPDHAAHIENDMDPVIADAMFDAVKASFTRLSQKFYTWKVNKHGHDKMMLSDLQAVPGAEGYFDWDDARTTILRALRHLSPKFSRIAQKFFDENHIDGEPREGKDQTPFMLSVGPEHLPFILVNFDNDVNSVVILGHELGHGVHQVLAERAQGVLLSDMSTPVAETASIFAEMLVFDEILSGEKDPEIRAALMEDHIDNMLGNGLQQLAYYDFERRVHAEREKGELGFERISDIWIETQREYYGPAVTFDDYDRYSWVAVSHFFETPFYVYSYSFAQMVVGALFQEYQKARFLGKEAQEAFADRYQEFLETGITKNFQEMFAPFGLDPEKPQFWESGLTLIEKCLTDLTGPDVPPPAPPVVFLPPPPPPPSLGM